MRLHTESTVASTLAIPVAASLLCAAVLLFRAKPYDVEATVERVYRALKTYTITAGQEYDTSKWVCIPVAMDVTNQFVDIGVLLEQVHRWGCTIIASAVTDHPNRRNLIVRVPKRQNPSRWLDLLAVVVVALNVTTIYAYHEGLLP